MFKFANTDVANKFVTNNVVSKLKSNYLCRYK